MDTSRIAASPTMPTGREETSGIPDSPCLRLFSGLQEPTRAQQRARVAGHIAAVPLAAPWAVARMFNTILLSDYRSDSNGGECVFNKNSSYKHTQRTGFDTLIAPVVLPYNIISAAARNIAAAAHPARSLEHGSLKVSKKVAYDLWRLLASIPRDRQLSASNGDILVRATNGFVNMTKQMHHLSHLKHSTLSIKSDRSSRRTCFVEGSPHSGEVRITIPDTSAMSANQLEVLGLDFIETFGPATETGDPGTPTTRTYGFSASGRARYFEVPNYRLSYCENRCFHERFQKTDYMARGIQKMIRPEASGPVQTGSWIDAVPPNWPPARDRWSVRRSEHRSVEGDVTDQNSDHTTRSVLSEDRDPPPPYIGSG